MRFSILAVAIFAGTGCKKGGDEATVKAPPTPVKVPLATATTADTPVQLVLTGLITADQRAEVTSDIQGRALEVMVQRGDRVKMGASLVKLDVQTQGLAAREAYANVEAARAQRKLADEECKRVQALLDKGAITRSEYDRQMAQCTSALQSVSAAEARAAMMSKQVTDGIVRAPFDGIIAERSITPGEWVAPGRSLFTLVDDDPLRIQLSVPEAAVKAVKQDEAVQVIAVADPDHPHPAKVTRMGAEINPRSRALVVEATLEPGSGLYPGMFAEARLEIDHKARPTLPPEAIEKRGTGLKATNHVFVVKNKELHDTIVQLGPVLASGQVSIASGLKEGEKVVTKLHKKMMPKTEESPGSGSGSGSAAPATPAAGSGSGSAEQKLEEKLVTTGPDGKDIVVVDGLVVEE